MRRMGTAKEVAKLVLFLLCDDSSYITGAESASTAAYPCSNLSVRAIFSATRPAVMEMS
jgi:NAD(P)-dependent dehydrogenase (short-subunit alcohol dehydrogenase family)